MSDLNVTGKARLEGKLLERSSLKLIVLLTLAFYLHPDSHRKSSTRGIFPSRPLSLPTKRKKEAQYIYNVSTPPLIMRKNAETRAAANHRAQFYHDASFAGAIQAQCTKSRGRKVPLRNEKMKDNKPPAGKSGPLNVKKKC